MNDVDLDTKCGKPARQPEPVVSGLERDGNACDLVTFLVVAWADGERAPELACGDIVAEKTYVIPAFGFVTTNKPPKRPTRRPARMFTTRPYFLDSAGVDRGQLTIKGSEGPVATIRRMAILSEGRRSR
jgi:hypothetical protein